MFSCAQIPISLPYVPTFRALTNTEGVDFKALTYKEMCTANGVMQTTADTMDGLGLNAADENPFLPNAAILRTAEAVDSVLNSARSGMAETRRESGGMILCSMVQLGGLIYFAFILVIAVVMLQCLPCVNLIFRLMFETSVALCSSGTSAQRSTTNRLGSNRRRRLGTQSGAPRVPVGAAVATNSWGSAVGNVHVSGTDANGNAIYKNEPKPQQTLKETATHPQRTKPVVTVVASLVDDARAVSRKLFGSREQKEETSRLVCSDEEDDSESNRYV